MPEHTPLIPNAFLNNMPEMTLKEISYVIANLFLGDDIDSACIKKIIDQTLDFPVPLVKIEPDIYVLELFHGPTLTFKDIGARFMARLISVLSPGPTTPLNVLVATTGNTGSAVANGFYGIKGTNVFVLYPKGKMGRSQEAQFTTLGRNIHAIEIQGTIDDCQALLKNALSNDDLNRRIQMTSANSINIGRLLPQLFYYFYAYARMAHERQNPNDIHIAVPCGNLGNLSAGYMSIKMGLPIKRLVASCNANDSFHLSMSCGRIINKNSIPTIAYAMDTGKPSNLPRIMDMCGGDISKLKQHVTSSACSDKEICDTINKVADNTGYVLDPHAAVAYKCLKESMVPGGTGLILATAHPAKSIDAMSAITGKATELPLQLTRFMSGQRVSTKLPATFPALKKHLLNQCTTIL